jgi:hypothetical protein
VKGDDGDDDDDGGDGDGDGGDDDDDSDDDEDDDDGGDGDDKIYIVCGVVECMHLPGLDFIHTHKHHIHKCICTIDPYMGA